MDPEGPFNCQPLLGRAYASTQPGYSFTFSARPAQKSPQAHPHPEPKANILSLLPREHQLSILELLPTSSVSSQVPTLGVLQSTSRPASGSPVSSLTCRGVRMLFYPKYKIPMETG